MSNTMGWVLLGVFPLVVVVAAFIARRRWTGNWRIAATLPIVAILGDLVFSYASTLLDPTDHPLWPYELMVITAISAVFLIAAASLRRDSLKKQQ